MHPRSAAGNSNPPVDGATDAVRRNSTADVTSRRRSFQRRCSEQRFQQYSRIPMHLRSNPFQTTALARSPTTAPHQKKKSRRRDTVEGADLRVCPGVAKIQPRDPQGKRNFFSVGPCHPTRATLAGGGRTICLHASFRRKQDIPSLFSPNRNFPERPCPQEQIRQKDSPAGAASII